MSESEAFLRGPVPLPARHIVPVCAGATPEVPFEFTAELRGTFISNMDGGFTNADALLQQQVACFGQGNFVRCGMGDEAVTSLKAP